MYITLFVLHCPHDQALGSLQCSLTNASLHLWDALTFQQVSLVTRVHVASYIERRDMQHLVISVSRHDYEDSP